MTHTQRILYVDNVATLAALTVKLPMKVGEGERASVGCQSTITALTVLDGFGRAIPGAPTSLAGGSSIVFRYVSKSIGWLVSRMSVAGVTGAAPLANPAFTDTVQLSGAGGFYQDAGATVARWYDRMLMGAAADNPAHTNRAATPTDWLSTAMAATTVGAWATWGAQGAALARYGTIGFLGGSRTSDAYASSALLGYTPSSIGVAAWVINDDTQSPTTTTGYAFYGEAWRMSGASYKPVFGLELEAVNFGNDITEPPNPYTTNQGGGAYCVQLGSGGGQTSGTTNASGCIIIVDNPNAFHAGLVVGATALVGTNGNDSGYGAAVSLAKNQALEWHTPEVVATVAGHNVGAFIRSTVAAVANGVRQEFEDNAVVFSNISGLPVFNIQSIASPTNILQVQAGTGAQAAGIYVQEGAGGSPNLGLFPATGGELQLTSPVTNAGGTITATAAGGFLHININGSDYRIPLLTPAQAGG
jgi:hypothetical protein